MFDSLDFQAVFLSHNSVNSQLACWMGLRNRSLKWMNYILGASVTPKKTCKFLFMLSLSKRKSSKCKLTSIVSTRTDSMEKVKTRYWHAVFYAIDYRPKGSKWRLYRLKHLGTNTENIIQCVVSKISSLYVQLPGTCKVLWYSLIFTDLLLFALICPCFRIFQRPPLDVPLFWSKCF